MHLLHATGGRAYFLACLDCEKMPKSAIIFRYFKLLFFKAAAMSREEKIKQIKEMFSTLYCFTSDEISQYLKSAEQFPEDGLDKLVLTLQDGKKQQDQFLTRRVEEDKRYVQDLSQFLRKTSSTLKASYEETEHDQAESILGKM